MGFCHQELKLPAPSSLSRQVAPWAMHHPPWPPVTQTPSEAPWITCPRWTVWDPCLAPGVAVQVEGLLLGSV